MKPVGLRLVGQLVAAAGVTAFFAAATPVLAIDDDGPAKPRIDCTKPVNKKKPACKPHNVSDDAVINGAYWLAHTGRLAESLALLGTVQDRENPRLLNAIGFATRKMGDVDGALPYYARALEIEPDYVQAREYMGEAFLAKGDLAHATEQLGEIERRCGQGCVAFTELKRQIVAFEATHPQRG
ncbi:MAG: tetratricopeptide repeat protein [Hyphomicrobium zavarzinii]|jgi:tetratricopeptide (TPR) repeat protein|uniref:tetratricopeptide repeat protein n=1 Tax=Hyphomicrobium TaxID=81 RepID=UPI00037A5F93|nr:MULTISPECIES: tetratricopeptide repeat protein [Hyphomicrobium]MBL8847804.1 tetratricopeptide repeat protein [Hyphomicrobium zavarzinii]WBT39228.1 tetratricopeptide repeat protein [Hyphomicrobium sp. DMF-1]HML42755.1 tetratricopeptide repeat protein [Hyphomicrobium zavarzinii]